jgi:hypothetical protein
MTLTKGSLMYVVTALGWTLNGCGSDSLSVDEIIEQNTQAMGGRPAIEAVKSIEIDLHIADPDFQVNGKYRAARPGRMRIDILADDKHVYTEAFDGDRGWKWKGEGSTVEEESPKAIAALRHGVELPGKLFGLHELREHGHRVDLAKRETIDGTKYYVLRVTLSDGYTTTLYTDPSSWLITRRRDFRPLHVDVDPTPTTIESRFSDFRKIDGILFAFVSTDADVATGKILETASVRSVKLNPQFDASIFTTL